VPSGNVGLKIAIPCGLLPKSANIVFVPVVGLISIVAPGSWHGSSTNRFPALLIVNPVGQTNGEPDATTVCQPVVGSTRITFPELSATKIFPLASTAIPSGSTKLPPDETVVDAPVTGFIRITPPA